MGNPSLTICDHLVVEAFHLSRDGKPVPPKNIKDGYGMELAQRKANRIPEFDYSTTGAYVVTICTQDRRKILGDIVGDGSPVPLCRKIDF